MRFEKAISFNFSLLKRASFGDISLMLGIEIFMVKGEEGKFYYVANNRSMLVNLMIFILIDHIWCSRKKSLINIWNKKLNMLLIKQRKAILMRKSEQNKQVILYRFLGGLELEEF